MLIERRPMNQTEHESSAIGHQPNKPIRGPLFFINMMRHHWPAMAVGGLLSLLATLAAIGLLSLSGWFIAATAYAGLNVTTSKAFNFFLPSIGVRLFAMLRTGARYGERLACHDATFRILETLRTWCYHRLEPLAPAGLAKHHSGDLLTRIITDIDTLDNLYLRVISPSAIAIVVVALLLGFIGHFSPVIAIYNTGLFLLAGVGIPIMADITARSAARQLNVGTARLRTTLVDGIHGLAALLACGAYQSHLGQVGRRQGALVQNQQRMSQVTGMANASMVLISGAAVAGTLYIGAEAVSNGTLSGPQLALLALAVMAGFDVVVPLSGAYQYLGQTRKAAGRLLTITETAPAITFPNESASPPKDMAIEFDHVSFQYDQTPPIVLRDISFSISSGHRTAIMGATGSGKSTLFYLLSRFEDPTQGQIRLGQCNLNRFSEASLREHICIVDQRSHIFNGTLRDNLLLVDPEAGDDRLEEALAVVRLMDFVKDLPEGLDTWVGEAGRMLSGGQARRLAIARAALSKAPILAFDEPTEGLDAETAEAMMNNLLKSGKDRTIIMITHRPEAIEHMDQVVLMKAGCMTSVGSPKHLKAQSPLYRRLISSH